MAACASGTRVCNIGGGVRLGEVHSQGLHRDLELGLVDGAVVVEVEGLEHRLEVELAPLGLGLRL